MRLSLYLDLSFGNKVVIKSCHDCFDRDFCFSEMNPVFVGQII